MTADCTSTTDPSNKATLHRLCGYCSHDIQHAVVRGTQSYYSLLVQVEGRCLHKLGAHLLKDKALHGQYQLVRAQHAQHQQLLHRGQGLLPGLWQGLIGWTGRVKEGLPWQLQALLINFANME